MKLKGITKHGDTTKKEKTGADNKRRAARQH